MSRKQLTPLEFVNPVDSTFLSVGWTATSGGRYELNSENARDFAIRHGSTGELFMQANATGWWTSKNFSINGYNDIDITSDNTHIEMWADDYIQLKQHFATNHLRIEGENVLVNANPAVAMGVTPKQYVDAAAALRVLKTGDTMTGMLTLTTPLPTPALTINAANVNSIVVTSGSVDFQDGLSVQGEINLMGFIYADAADFQGDVSFSANVASDVTMGINGSDDMWLTCTEVRLYDGVTIANASKGLIKFDAGDLVLGAMGAGTFNGVRIRSDDAWPSLEITGDTASLAVGNPGGSLGGEVWFYTNVYVENGGKVECTGGFVSSKVPINGNDITNKQYVDSVSGGGGGSADALHVGPSAPTDANIELWWDTDDDQDRQGINAQTGTSYTFVLGDENQLVTFTSATAVTATIPTNAVAAFPIGSRIDLAQLGAGAVTVSGAGVTIKATPSAILRANGSAATLIKYATDTWLLTGDLA